jgi:hypothetical protein
VVRKRTNRWVWRIEVSAVLRAAASSTESVLYAFRGLPQKPVAQRFPRLERRSCPLERVAGRGRLLTLHVCCSWRDAHHIAESPRLYVPQQQINSTIVVREALP